MKANNPMFKYILKNDLFDALMDYSFYMHFLTGLSLFNCTTLMVQRNGVGYAASEDTWRKEFDRYIKPEAQPLIIMRPFAPLDVFYEYRDTYSPDGKEPVYDLGIAVSAADQFIKWLEEDPFLYSYIRNIY